MVPKSRSYRPESTPVPSTASSQLRRKENGLGGRQFWRWEFKGLTQPLLAQLLAFTASGSNICKMEMLLTHLVGLLRRNSGNQVKLFITLQIINKMPQSESYCCDKILKDGYFNNKWFLLLTVWRPKVPGLGSPCVQPLMRDSQSNCEWVSPSKTGRQRVVGTSLSILG